MSAYAVYSPNPSIQYTCPICLNEDSSTNPDTIAHTGLGQKHPVHKACIRLWLEAHNACPNCKTQIDKRSLFPWKERSISEIKSVARDIFLGTVGATIGGIAGSVLRTALGAVSLRGTPIPIGLPEAFGAGVGFALTDQMFNGGGLRAIISRMVLSAVQGGVLGSVAMAGFPIVRTPIGACAVMGAVSGAFCGLFERHW